MQKKKEILIAAGIALVILVSKHFSKSRQSRQAEFFKSLSAQKYKETLVQIADSISLPYISPELATKILHYSISKLQRSLDKHKITCTEIFLAYTQQIRIASCKLNSVVDIDISQGYARAQKLDRELISGHRRSGLHGIPISVKDFIAVKGLISTYGCSSLSYNRLEKDAYLVKVLKKKGALIYVKSSMFQNAAFYETVNPVTGIGKCPYDNSRSCGGSSGGDAILVSTHGSLLGLGTDFGGSLRFPALSCGVFTLKPSSARISRAGPHSLQDYPKLKNAWGPIARSVDDLRIFYSEVLSVKPAPTLPFLPWKSETFESQEKIKIGFCLGNEFWPIPHCMKRCIVEAKVKLESLGHKLVEFVLENEIREINEIKIGVYSYDKRDSERLKGEKPQKEGYKIERAMKFPSWLKKIYSKYIEYRKGEKESFYYKCLNFKSGLDYSENIARMELFKSRFMKKVEDAGIDVLLFPYPFPAIPHGTSPELLPGFAYLAIFNVMDWPVGSVPMGFIKESEQNYHEGFENWNNAMQEVMKGSQGLPLGIQVAGMPYREEVVLRIMQEITS